MNNPLDPWARHWLAERARRSFYTWDAVQLERHQTQRIAHVLKYVKRNSPYYQQKLADGWNGQLEDLPIMTKAEMIAHFDVINTAGLHQEPLVELLIAQEKQGRADLYEGKYSIGLSSGTSGSRLVTVLSPSERWQYASLLFARSGIPEHVRWPRVLFTLRVNNPAFMETRALGVTLWYMDYTSTIETMIEVINTKALNILAGPPSLLRMLARQRDQILHHVDGLISYAEVLDDDCREELQQIFEAPVAEIYQGAEGFIASTCRNGRLHLNEDVVLVETLSTADSLGNAQNVIVTDLYRTTQPFLRYLLNDILETDNQPCKCGSVFRVVERIHGRADDVFHLYAADGSGEIRYLFPDYVVRSINQASNAIQEFQAIQHSPEKIEIRLSLGSSARLEEVAPRILNTLRFWSEKTGGRLGEVIFNTDPPERNAISHKLIRVTRRFQ
jgi:putative adenylate-forming enzyme